MAVKLKFILILLFIISAFAIKPWGPLQIIEDIANSGFQTNYNQTQYWYNSQLLDHFNLLENQTWSQRYWIVSDYYKPEINGPVFFYICGEYTCPGLPNYRLFPLELAEEFGALIVVLEHRFYGLSQPFGNGDLTVDRLTYLTVDQGLYDLAYFMNWIRTSGNFNVSESTKFATIGGSYPGALSAWFREKFPYLTVGALASSAVVNS